MAYKNADNPLEKKSHENEFVQVGQRIKCNFLSIQ